QKCNESLSSQQLTVPYCCWSSTRTPVSALSILENNANSYDTKAFGMARPKRIFQQDSWLEERFYKSNTMFSEKVFIFIFIFFSTKKISIAELLSGIDSVSRALENERKEKFSSLRPCDIPGFQITHKGEVYRDWRGMIAPNPMQEDDQMRQKCLRLKVKKMEFQANKKKTAASSTKSEKKNLSDKRLSLQTRKLKKNATRPEVFETACDNRKHPNSEGILKAVVCIQRYVRGWLVHRAFKRIKIKSASHGPCLLSVVRYYRKMMARIKHGAGVLDLSTPLHYFELEEWMDKKKFYETMFSKRELDQKMDRNHLPEFFRDCGYFIPATGVHRIFQLFFPAYASAVRSIKKHQAVEMAFTLFPPLGAKVKNIITVPLPWLHPFLDGRGGSKKSGK
ncbi:IQCM protein, partial [Alectura lathami]|nr:IQCM protein [Alectura lathami]